ncbi:MAG TPA: pimeloyl-ACP methyl ester esterase BioH [Casimicrobiaceae bacterium]|nr:pimeloyl-ACP methyl ester esterase BioH [Casimicrobiaceae bacterium]
MRATRVHVESRGRGRDVVLLHGWALHGGLFTSLAESLSSTRRVHTVDLPGHGHSDPIRPWTIDAVVAALERRFEDIDAQIDVIGWSLGGMLAMAWANAYPARVGRLALVATTPKFVADADWPFAMSRATLERFADELRVAYKPALLRFLSLQVQGSDEGRAALASLRQQLFARGAPDAEVLDDSLRSLEASDLRDIVPRLPNRALVIAGDSDALTPIGASRWLASALPSARLVVVPGAAHTPFLSHARVFTAAVEDFLHDG